MALSWPARIICRMRSGPTPRTRPASQGPGRRRSVSSEIVSIGGLFSQNKKPAQRDALNGLESFDTQLYVYVRILTCIYECQLSPPASSLCLRPLAWRARLTLRGLRLKLQSCVRQFTSRGFPFRFGHLVPAPACHCGGDRIRPPLLLLSRHTLKQIARTHVGFNVNQITAIRSYQQARCRCFIIPLDNVRTLPVFMLHRSEIAEQKEKR
jgi:hypothetical protein